jgi:chromosome segregation ATPase
MLSILTTFNQGLSLVALLIGIANALWLWISRPARDSNKRIDETIGKVDELEAEMQQRVDRHREDLKEHDRRIQRLEDQFAHLPTKDDLHKVANQLTAVKSELDSIASAVRRIDDFLRNRP